MNTLTYSLFLMGTLGGLHPHQGLPTSRSLTYPSISPLLQENTHCESITVFPTTPSSMMTAAPVMSPSTSVLGGDTTSCCYSNKSRSIVNGRITTTANCTRGDIDEL